MLGESHTKTLLLLKNEKMKTKVPNVFLGKGLSIQKQTATRKRFLGA